MRKGSNKTSHNLIATRSDIQALTVDLQATETRLNKRIDQVMEYIDFKIKPLEEMGQDYYDFKNKIFDRLDWIIGKLQKFDQELTISNEYVRQSLDHIENHEGRITDLEGIVHP